MRHYKFFTKVSYFIFSNFLSILLSQPSLFAQTPPVNLREGCVTAFYVDKDCDGFGVGNKDGQSGFPLGSPTLPNLEPDADDIDPTVNTPETVFGPNGKYGTSFSIDDFKRYLADAKGLTHQVGNIFFVSLDGDNSTAMPNDPTRPYRTRPIGNYTPPVIRPGDVVVYRGGRYSGALDTTGHTTWQPGVGTRGIGLQGSPNLPILMTVWPGERVIFSGSASSFGFSYDTRDTIVDGFEFDGQYAPNQFAREVVTINSVPLNGVQLRNSEIRNGGRWGIFGYIGTNRDNVTIGPDVVIHRVHGEHCLYWNDAPYSETYDTDIGRKVTKILAYYCDGHALHWRGGEGFEISDNILHSVNWMGVEIKNGSRNGLIKNNLIFNVGRFPITVWDTNEIQNGSDIHDLTFVNNIFAAKSGSNGVGSPPDSSAGFAINIAHGNTNPIRTHRNLSFYNNIFHTENNFPFSFSHGPSFVDDIAQAKIEKNIFWRVRRSSANDDTGMRVCNDDPRQSVGATSGPYNQSYCPNVNYYNLNDMQNPIYRPNIKDNLLSDPLFANVSNNYLLTPWLYNFDPTSASPSVDFGLAQFAPPADIRGNPRGNNPDAGTYEFSNISRGGPRLDYLNPDTIMNGTAQLIQLLGANFDPQAQVKIELPGVGWMFAPSSSVNVVSPNQIDLTFPAQLFAGNYNISVVNPQNRASGIQILRVTQNPAFVPVLLNVSPNRIPFGVKTDVYLTGRSFGTGSEYFVVKVIVNGREYPVIPQYITRVSSSMIIFHVPDWAPVGTYGVLVETWAGRTQVLNITVSNTARISPILINKLKTKEAGSATKKIVPIK